MDPDPLEREFETVTVDEHGAVVQRAIHTAREQLLSLAGGVILEMVAVPGGIFQMGSPPYTGYPDERPQHIVTLPPFWIGKFLVTQEQWGAVMRKQPPFRFHGAKLPVENVSWHDAVAFCERLSHLARRSFHLPAEAQWEFACRAGTATPFHFGDTITTGLANYCGEYSYKLEPKGVYRHSTTEVGAFPANRFGLHDMHGNLWEWCADAWHPDYQGAPPDGSPWETGQPPAQRILRGGSWHEPPDHCRSAVRLGLDPGEKDDFFGFRVAC